MTNTFNRLTVVTFESRRSNELAGLVERLGGKAITAPSMRELPLPESPQADAFADELVAGRIDMIIFLTGVGARGLMSLMEKKYPREKIVAALSNVTRVSRGPKPVA